MSPSIKIHESHCEHDTFATSDWRPKDHWKCRDRIISTAKDFDVTFSSVLEQAAQHFNCIAIDADILGGTPRIAGTRIPVYMILDAIDFYGDVAGVLKSYPQLSLEQVKEAIGFAGEVMEHAIEHESEIAAR